MSGTFWLISADDKIGSFSNTSFQTTDWMQQQREWLRFKLPTTNKQPQVEAHSDIANPSVRVTCNRHPAFTAAFTAHSQGTERGVDSTPHQADGVGETRCSAWIGVLGQHTLGLAWRQHGSVCHSLKAHVRTTDRRVAHIRCATSERNCGGSKFRETGWALP
jgi:hypothetical protein